MCIRDSLGTGKEQHITITAGSNMSQTEIDRAVAEAKMFAAADKARKDAVDARNEAESIVVQIEKNIKDVDGKIKDDDKVLLESDVKMCIRDSPYAWPSIGIHSCWLYGRYHT